MDNSDNSLEIGLAFLSKKYLLKNSFVSNFSFKWTLVIWGNPHDDSQSLSMTNYRYDNQFLECTGMTKRSPDQCDLQRCKCLQPSLIVLEYVLLGIIMLTSTLKRRKIKPI